MTDESAASFPGQSIADFSLKTATRADGRKEGSPDLIRLFSGTRGRLAESALDALRRSGVLWRFNFTLRGDWLGQRVAVPFVFGNGIQHIRTGERWMFELIQRLLRLREGAFVDVGANLGQTLLKVKMADSARPYYGFEPNPLAYSYLAEFVRRNRFQATTLLPVGLSGVSGVATLFSKSDADPSASIVEGFRSADRYSCAQGVSVHRGDDVIDALKVKDIAIVKIDVEGAELDVLEGLRHTILTHRPCIVCEVLPVYDPATETGRFRKSRQDALTQLLNELAYGVYLLDRNGAAVKLDGFPVHSDITRSNYLFAPDEGTARASIAAV